MEIKTDCNKNPQQELFLLCYTCEKMFLTHLSSSDDEAQNLSFLSLYLTSIIQVYKCP